MACMPPSLTYSLLPAPPPPHPRLSPTEFDCTHEVSPADINRVQWECKSPSGCKVCVKDVRVVRSDTPAGAPYKSSGGGK